jgi:hypothetical protein
MRCRRQNFRKGVAERWASARAVRARKPTFMHRSTPTGESARGGPPRPRTIAQPRPGCRSATAVTAV